ncbi:TPA: hypothetical protein ACGZ9Q_002022 [Elizabethkingia anophelis]|uniref:hypothetical protein n=1 Tax=Elizabethkingia anophelis TaxID=1117645 RepID=UPI00099B1658|nr:hypothetical protein [Elizabethkingia anophelis]MCT3896762.1 hypothetical protein [Elizabethkingia anophelis]MDV3566740.1 hypothetical protein [Elizabethkingia anophelis]MDV3972062.1 hypothetical protein [Elizabethkingia anophelis]OPC43595.1 hypothetical protein BAY02_16990 [Elizabethkingia anophelis]QRI50335.1 hypothetical protein JQC76_02215 [Elizabethkingia anophelis]
MKNYILFILIAFILVSCDQKAKDQKILENTLDFILKKNNNKEINVFNEIKNYKEVVNFKLKNINIISCKEIFDKGESNFYVLKFNHSAQNETTVDVINYNTLESFKLKFKNNVVETESLHSDGMNRPRMIFLKQLRKQKLYLNDEGFKYVDTFPSDSITCK